jgi:putative peptide zinc metalloprotease protein
MLVTESTRISPFDGEQWVISTPTGRNLLVSGATARLLAVLREANTAEQAYRAFTGAFGPELGREQFDGLVQRSFGGYQILSTDATPGRPVQEPYIKLRLELLPARAAAVLAKPVLPLFSPRVFCVLLGAQAAALLTVWAFWPALPSYQGADYWVAAPLIYASLLLHEVGHVAACARFGVRHGGIGFGFYAYVLPVFYADITGIWAATKPQRLIANLGGIYMQLLFAGALAGGYLVSGFAPLLLAAAGVTVSALWQFNPFARHDGYWMLSDLTNTPNLLTRASEVVRAGFSRQGAQRVLTSRGKVLLSRKLFLLMYGLVNALLLVAFASFTIWAHGPDLLAFPSQLLSLLPKALNGQLALGDFHSGQLVVMTFYTMLARYGLTWLRRRYRQPALTA